MLTRERMEEVIRNGGSVLHKGAVITELKDLPSKAALAKGDPAKESAAMDDLKAEMKRLQGELKSLQDSQKAAGEATAGGAADPNAPAS